MMWIAVAVGLGALTPMVWVVLSRRAHFVRVRTPPRSPEQRASGTRRTVVFPARDKTQLEGWLFLPNTPNAPLVIMAPGPGGTKDGLLESFAWRFMSEGVAALAFDY